MLRSWTIGDVDFSLKVRNHPELMQHFRQDVPISPEEQYEFIKEDVSEHGTYNGLVIEADGEPVGLCGVKDTGEFTLGLLPEYQGRGIATEAMKQLIAQYGPLWSEVFVGNPALEWFIAKLGFRVVSVKERAYYKQSLGLIDIVKVYHE